MTLNIMAVSRERVYLTGDFRITYKQGRKSTERDQYEIQKLIPISKYGWCALVAFCGVARKSDGEGVDEWIANQLNIGKFDEKLDTVLNRLKLAESWLSDIPGDRYINISIVGFRRRKPFVYVLSNGQNRKSPTLVQTYLRPKKPYVEIFGMTHSNKDVKIKSVTDQEKNVLRSSIAWLESGQYMNLLSDINQSASEKVEGVSTACAVGFLTPIITGNITPYRVPNHTSYFPGFVIQEFLASGCTGFELKVDESNRPLHPYWKGCHLESQILNGTNVLLSLHVVCNVKRPIIDPTRKSPKTTVLWRVGTDHEPDTYRFKLEPAKD